MHLGHELLELGGHSVSVFAHHVHDESFFFFSSRRRHTRFKCDWSSDVCSSDLDVNWAEIEEPNSKVRTHPVRWLQLLAVSIFAIVLLTPVLGASDLSRYREFQLGIDRKSVV